MMYSAKDNMFQAIQNETPKKRYEHLNRDLQLLLTKARKTLSPDSMLLDCSGHTMLQELRLTEEKSLALKIVLRQIETTLASLDAVRFELQLPASDSFARIDTEIKASLAISIDELQKAQTDNRDPNCEVVKKALENAENLSSSLMQSEQEYPFQL